MGSGFLRYRRTLAILAIGLIAAIGSPAPVAAKAPVRPHPLMAQPRFMSLHGLQLPLTPAQCLAFGLTCMGPPEFTKAYNLGPLYKKGLDGRGRTIVIVDSFGSPTIREDMAVWDAEFGLPPVSLQVISPAGSVPFDPTNGDMLSWAGETTLDVEMAHSIAPGAKILLVTTPVSETEGVQGFPEMMFSENYVIDHGLGDVISQSFAAVEETFPSRQSILDLRGAFKNAYRHDVTVVAGSGDTGATGPFLDLSCCYAQQVVAWPASDPLVTALGGTRVHLDVAGNRTSPDTVWNDFGAPGGGKSSVFSRPEFQDGVAKVVGRSRGVPDISMASFCFGAWFYSTFDPNPDFQGWGLTCGTSEASPLFSGIVAIADQAAGKRLGFLNDRLYELLGNRHTGLVDVTSGNNTFAGVQGFEAGPGYDLASGLGTLDGTLLVKSLAEKGGNSQDGSQMT